MKLVNSNGLSGHILALFIIFTLFLSPIILSEGSTDRFKSIELRYLVIPLPQGSHFVIFNYTRGNLKIHGYYVFSKAFVSIVYVPSNHTLRFRVELINGTFYSCYIANCSVSKRNVTFVYGGTYIVKNGNAYSLNDSWEGFFPYLININVRKPELKPLCVYLYELGGCWISNETIPLILKLGKQLNINFTVIPPNTWYSLCGIKSKNRDFTIIGCDDLMFVLVKTNPFAKVGGYAYGNVSIPASELIKAFVIQGQGKGFLAEVHRKWDNGSVIAKGVAILPGKERLFLLLNASALPKSFVRAVKEVCDYSLTGLVVTASYIARGYLVYHVSGFLIYAYLSGIPPLVPCIFLGPTFDLQMKYCWNNFVPRLGGYGLTLNRSYGGAILELIEARGLPSYVSIAPKPAFPLYGYLVAACVIAIAIVVVIVLKVRRVGK